MLALMLIAALIALLSLAGVVLSITTGLLASGIDGLFVIFACLMMAAIFGGLALSLASQGGYLPSRGRSDKG